MIRRVPGRNYQGGGADSPERTPEPKPSVFGVPFDPSRGTAPPRNLAIPARPRHLLHVIRSTGNVCCSSCGRPAPEPRKGLCFGCYMRSRRGHETGLACECCGVTDRRVLRRHALDELRTLCANCSAVAGRRALSLDELRCEVFPPGDRRGPGRRTGDRRAPVDRRQRVEVEHLLSDADRRGSGRRTGDRLDAAAE